MSNISISLEIWIPDVEDTFPEPAKAWENRVMAEVLISRKKMYFFMIFSRPLRIQKSQ